VKVYKTQEEVNTDTIDGVLKIDGDVKFDMPGVYVKGNIDAGNINAGHINARNINAWHIDAGDINAGDINAGDINAGDINAWNINAGDINAWNINAGDINAWDISAEDINYYGVCFAYQNIVCTSIRGCRDNSKHFCLDGEIKIKGV